MRDWALGFPFFLILGCMTAVGCAVPVTFSPQNAHQVVQGPRQVPSASSVPTTPSLVPTCYWTAAPVPPLDANGVTPPAPTPYWTCHPQLIETGEAIPSPEVHPRFDVKQPESLVDSILADGKPHTVTVLFVDKYRFRVRYNQGTIRGESNWGIVALSDTEGALAAVESALSLYRFKWIAPPFAFPAELPPHKLTEETIRQEEMADADERELESKAGYDLPNRGSFATLTMADYTPEKLKALIKTLNSLPFVMTAEVVPPVEPAVGSLISNNE